MLKIFFATALLGTSVLATNTTVYVNNHCSFPLYVTSVASTVGSTVPIAATGTWSEPQHRDPKTGIAIKVAVAEDALYTSKSVLIFGYTVNFDVPDIYYDLTSTYGYAKEFEGKKINIHGDEGKDVPTITWNGSPPGEQQTKRYVGTTNLVLEVCS